VCAERVRELDDDLAGDARRAELSEIDGVDPPRADPSEAGREAIDLAPDAEAGGRREQCERRDEKAEDEADRGEPDEVGERRATKEHSAHHVREARRAAVLDRALAYPRLDDLEVEKTRNAVPTPE